MKILIITLLLNSLVILYSEASKEIILTQKQQIEILKEKNEIILNQNKELINTTMWFFGISLTVILFILGSLSYSNNRKLDKDLKLIKSELENEKQSEFINLEKRIFSSNKSFEKRINELEVKIRETVINEVESSKSKLETEIKILKIDFLEHTIESSSKKQIPFFEYCEIVKNASGIFDKEYKILEILKDIENRLDPKDLDPFYEETLDRLLSFVPEKYNNAKIRVKNKLRT